MKRLHSLIANIRAKPPHVRQRIVLFTSGAVTAVIFLFWILSMSSYFAGGIAISVNSASDSQVSAFSAIKNNFVDSMAQSLQGFDKLFK